jgi:hypothetical protein
MKSSFYLMQNISFRQTWVTNVVAAFLGKETVERLEPSGDCVLQTEVA